jgi:plasmid stability protein
MATLYVENVPDEIYEALRKRARQNRTSISAEIIGMLRDNIPTAAELKRRQEFFKFVETMGKRKPLRPGPFPSSEQMVREDRER